MTLCAKEAVLLITSTLVGTSTNVARERIALKCSLPQGHEGPHKDEERNETWEPGRQTIVRNDDER